MPRPLLLALAAPLLFSACDASDGGPDVRVFDGVAVEAQGDATLATDGDELVISNVGASGADGLFLPGTPTSVDVLMAPIALAAGQGVGIAVVGDDGDILAGFKNRNRGRAAGSFDFEITYGDALGVEAVRVVYLLGGAVVLDIPNLPFRSGSGLRLATNSVGEGEGDTDSAHVVRRGGKYVVVSDSEGTGEAREAGGKARACEGFTVTPPIEVEGVSICADRIEVEPLDVSFPSSVAGVSVTGRSLGSFRIRALAMR